MTLKTIFVKSPPKADIEQARKVQSQADAAAHRKHIALQQGEDAYMRHLVDERAMKAREALVEEANKQLSKPETQLEIPKSMANKTMQQLGAENPREFFRLDPDPTVGVSTPKIEGFTTTTTSKIEVRNGQWYRIMKQPEYYLQYCTSPVDGVSKCLVLDTTSVNPSYLVISATLSYKGGIDIVHLSASRFQDLIESRPPLAEVLRVYRKTECSSVEFNMGAFDLTDAIPLWSTMK